MIIIANLKVDTSVESIISTEPDYQLGQLYLKSPLILHCFVRKKRSAAC